jgi:hypothetical protein
MPLALARPVGPDQQRTDAFDAAATVRQSWPDPGAGVTTPLTVPPRPSGPSVLVPARAPYMEPPPPRADGRPRLVDPQAWRPPPAGVPKLQRGALLLGSFLGVCLGFARAPYLCLGLLCLLALVVRTVSWTAESARERQHVRGRRRWYDTPFTVLSSPWYLVVATAGTLMLLLWAALVAFVVGVAYLLFRLPMLPGLVLMGASLAFSLWWGPGSRRVRVPSRRLVVALTSRSWSGWVAVLAVATGVALLGWFVLHDGVQWSPAPGPPWRSGTLLGALVRWM